MIQETIKINIPETSSFSNREKHVNTEIQKNIDLYNSRGFTVFSYDVLNKTNTYASVKFNLKRMIGA